MNISEDYRTLGLFVESVFCSILAGVASTGVLLCTSVNILYLHTSLDKPLFVLPDRILNCIYGSKYFLCAVTIKFNLISSAVGRSGSRNIGE